MPSHAHTTPPARPRAPQDFQRECKVPAPPPPAGGEGDPLVSGMSSVMSCYERELKAPLRNLLTGELGRTLLIQVRRGRGRRGRGSGQGMGAAGDGARSGGGAVRR